MLNNAQPPWGLATKIYSGNSGRVHSADWMWRYCGAARIGFLPPQKKRKQAVPRPCWGCAPSGGARLKRFCCGEHSYPAYAWRWVHQHVCWISVVYTMLNVLALMDLSHLISPRYDLHFAYLTERRYRLAGPRTHRKLLGKRRQWSVGTSPPPRLPWASTLTRRLRPRKWRWVRLLCVSRREWVWYRMQRKTAGESKDTNWSVAYSHLHCPRLAPITWLWRRQPHHICGRWCHVSREVACIRFFFNSSALCIYAIHVVDLANSSIRHAITSLNLTA